MTFELWLHIAVYAVSVGCLYRAISIRLKELAKRIDRQNHLAERMYRAEMRIRRLEEKTEEGLL